MIVQELNRVQHEFGYLPRPALEALARRLEVPLYRINEVASFYPHYRTTPPPELEVHVCRDMSCHLRGASALVNELKNTFAGEIQAGKVGVHPVSCLGRCDRAIAARLEVHRGAGGSAGEHGVFNCFGRTKEETIAAARSLLAGSAAGHSFDRDADVPDQSGGWEINVYKDEPRERRYRALRRVLDALRVDEAAAKLVRDEIINQALKNAVLLGMGGAGGQAYKKWSEVREQKSDRKYVVCNADESEPGTFKDRELLLRTPHLVLEGVLLAGVVIGATQGYIYIRHEYEECIAAVQAEIAWARKQRLCGEDLLGTKVDMQVEVFVSPGGYICGEQTALIQAIENKRAEPRNRPPELQTNGLWDMPTLVNNVETLAWTPAIIFQSDAQQPSAAEPAAKRDDKRSGGDRGGPDTDQSWYGRKGRPFGDLARPILENDKDWQSRQGKTPRFPGVRFFSISGDVGKPGVYEVENGITVGELLKLAGGVRNNLPLKAIAFSGPSGGFTPKHLARRLWPKKIDQILPADLKGIELGELQMHINYFRRWGLMLGAGIVVYADDADLVEQALACTRFFQAESCGKCVPCRIGSTKLAEIAADLAERRLDADKIKVLQSDTGPVQELSFAMESTAICGLGTVAPKPLTTLLQLFQDEITPYLSRES